MRTLLLSLNSAAEIAVTLMDAERVEIVVNEFRIVVSRRELAEAICAVQDEE